VQNRRLVSSVVIVCLAWWLALSLWAIWVERIPAWTSAFSRVPSLFVLIVGTAITAAGVVAAFDSLRQFVGLRSLRGHYFRGLTSSIGPVPTFLAPKERRTGRVRIPEGNLAKWLRLPPSTEVQRHMVDGGSANLFVTAFPTLADSIAAAKPEMIKLGPYQNLARAIYQTITHNKVAELPAAAMESGHGGATLLKHSVNVANEIFETVKDFHFEGVKSRKGTIEEAPSIPDYQLNPDDPLIPLVGLAHDIGKLDTIIPDPEREGQWLSLPGHDEAGGRILARIPEFWELPVVDRNALMLAVSFYHHPLSAPKNAGDRCRALMVLLMKADIEASFKENGDVTGEYLDDMPDEENEFPPPTKLMDAFYLIISQSGRINGRNKDYTVGYKRGSLLYLKEDDLRKALAYRFNSSALQDLRFGDGTYALSRKVTQLLAEGDMLYSVYKGMKYSSSRAFFKVNFYSKGKDDTEPVWRFMKSCIILRLDTGRLPSIEKIPDTSLIPEIIGMQYGENSAVNKKLGPVHAGPEPSEDHPEEWGDAAIKDYVGDQVSDDVVAVQQETSSVQAMAGRTVDKRTAQVPHPSMTASTASPMDGMQEPATKFPTPPPTLKPTPTLPLAPTPAVAPTPASTRADETRRDQTPARVSPPHDDGRCDAPRADGPRGDAACPGGSAGDPLAAEAHPTRIEAEARITRAQDGPDAVGGQQNRSPGTVDDRYPFRADKISSKTENLVRHFLASPMEARLSPEDLDAITTLFSRPILVAEAILKDFGAPNRGPSDVEGVPEPIGLSKRLKMLSKVINPNLTNKLLALNQARNYVTHEAATFTNRPIVMQALPKAGGTWHDSKLLIVRLIEILSGRDQEVWNIYQDAAGQPRTQRPPPDRTPAVIPASAPETGEHGLPSPTTSNAATTGKPTVAPVVIRESISGLERRVQSEQQKALADRGVTRSPDDAEMDDGDLGGDETPQSTKLYEDGPAWRDARKSLRTFRDGTSSVLLRRLAAGAGTGPAGVYEDIEIVEIDGKKIATISMQQLRIIRASMQWAHVLTMMYDRQQAGVKIPKWMTVSLDTRVEPAVLRLHLHLTRMETQMASGIRDDEDDTE
jgi:hypothetical protein